MSAEEPLQHAFSTGGEREERAAALGPLRPEDFYMENGLMVFTAVYHLGRGYCCNSACRHCPYK